MLKEFNRDMIQKETTILTSLIARELVAIFGKSQKEANELIVKYDVKDTLLQHPVLLHDSPNNWALTLLTKDNDLEAIEDYYMN
ncbi:hypothetical protein [Bacillus sp. FJAT-42315]|uniref:hypothetical protein n=1 Tax=Bacillus sp. FJAT-42315 TaxID=2014077 RepID=UPI000C24F5EC|nr:hypothetical protein [Bacillus sp. FJAT-42315]